MDAELTIQTWKFDAAMKELASEFLVDERDLIKEQMQLLLKTMIKYTPPANQKAGRATINADTEKMAMFVYPEHFDLVELRKDAERSKDGKAYRMWKGKLTDIGLRQIDTDGSKLKADHARFRNRRGRVVSGSNIVTSGRVGRAFRKTLYAHVGNVKRGWKDAADALGVSLPPWVVKSTGGPSGNASGGHINGLADADPYLVAFNNTPYIRDEGMLNRAMAVRIKDLEKWLKVRLAQRCKEKSAV